MSQEVYQALRARGVLPEAGHDWAGLEAECVGLVRRLHLRQARSLGLAPASDEVAVPAVALHLARALSDLTHDPVAVLDATGSWIPGPALPGVPEEDAPFATLPLDEGLALLTARRTGRAGGLDCLRALRDEASPYAHLVVDLTGLDRSGELIAACELLDAVAVVARSGRTTAEELRERLREVPGDRLLGVLLTGIS